jgi:hypothetical protein
MPRILPPDWLDEGRPLRIVVHWSGGTHDVSADDRQYYHYIVSGDGRVERGLYPVRANDSTSDRDGYAAHVRYLNTGSIGVALAGMHGSRERPYYPGAYPLTAVQWRAAVLLLVDLCEHYQIQAERRTLLTHAEVEPVLGVDQRGKWDIVVHPESGAVVAPTVVGDWMRARVAALIEGRDAGSAESAGSAPDWSSLRAHLAMWLAGRSTLDLRDGPSAAAAARHLQAEIGTRPDAILGPLTRAAIARYLAEAARTAADVVLLDSEADPPGWQQYDRSRGVAPLTRADAEHDA